MSTTSDAPGDRIGRGDPLSALLGPVLERATTVRGAAEARRADAARLRITAGLESTPARLRDAASRLADAADAMADATEAEVDDCALLRLCDALEVLGRLGVAGRIIRGIEVRHLADDVRVEVPEHEIRALATAWRADVRVTHLQVELPVELAAPPAGRRPAVVLWAWDSAQRAAYRPGVATVAADAEEVSDAR